MKIIIETPLGETIELTNLEEFLTKLFKQTKRKNTSPQTREEAECMLSCYLETLCTLTKLDLQILWYINNMPLRHGLRWTMEELLRKQYESGLTLKNLGEKTYHSPFRLPYP